MLRECILKGNSILGYREYKLVTFDGMNLVEMMMMLLL